MKALAAVLVTLALAAPVAAQTRAGGDEPTVAFRPFFLVTGESFAAKQTFDAVLGSHGLLPFWGGGVEVDFRQGVFVEINASHFSKTGQRVLVSNGQVFPLGIPERIALTPFEVAGGVRFKVTPRIIPYAAAGVGRYAYSETSDFAAAGEDVSTSHAGFLVYGGAEFRVHPWVGIGVDAALTRISGILGAQNTVSQAFDETNLGGTSIRVRVLVGR